MIYSLLLNSRLKMSWKVSLPSVIPCMFSFYLCVCSYATEWHVDPYVGHEGFQTIQFDENSQIKLNQHCWVNDGEQFAWIHFTPGDIELRVMELSTKTVMKLSLAEEIIVIDGHHEDTKVLCVLDRENPTVIEAYEKDGILMQRHLEGFRESPIAVKYSSNGEKVAYTASCKRHGSEGGVRVYNIRTGHDYAIATSDIFNQNPVWLRDDSGLIYEKTYEYKSFFGLRTNMTQAIMLALAPWDSVTDVKIAETNLHSVFYCPYDKGDSIVYIVFPGDSRDSAQLWEYNRRADSRKKLLSLNSLFGVGWKASSFCFSETGNIIAFGISSKDREKAGLWRMDIAKKKVERIVMGNSVKSINISPCGHSVTFIYGKKFILLTSKIGTAVTRGSHL